MENTKIQSEIEAAEESIKQSDIIIESHQHAIKIEKIIKSNNVNKIKALKKALAGKAVCVILIALFLASCSSVYWEDSRQTASGKHTFYRAGWPYSSSCAVYSQQPIKPMTFKRYSYWRYAN